MKNGMHKGILVPTDWPGDINDPTFFSVLIPVKRLLISLGSERRLFFQQWLGYGNFRGLSDPKKWTWVKTLCFWMILLAGSLGYSLSSAKPQKPFQNIFTVLQLDNQLIRFILKTSYTTHHRRAPVAGSKTAFKGAQWTKNSPLCSTVYILQPSKWDKNNHLMWNRYVQR